MDQLLDHLVYGTPDLLGAVERFAAATGLQPVEGGRHPQWGTRNFLVGLGGTTYLELLGPDLDAPSSIVDFTGTDRLLTWAIHPADLEAAVVAARAAGAELGEVGPMSRSTPTGETVSWRVSRAAQWPYDGVVPFVIDWGTTPRPATTMTDAGELLGFRGSHPQATEVRAALAALGADLEVTEGPPALTATVRGPRGEFPLG
ncbi:VOC family protein [Kribbella sandramycini]|uniref:VOC family protein n=1 Tax=Kribbella sandramycini TaxID=60450 RepID=A0A7Y4KXP8_9ACTN|nr:VOC family protein [Kribbella sandramycini]MBB6569577.1 hypothetical protein [Kribbella sandramycini]NOL40589.1 VOC family protein [Kribbella sandramycini]